MNKKILYLRIIFASLLIGTYILIFVFSSEDSAKSTQTSKSTMHEIINIFNGSKEIRQKEVDTYEPILRKIAHFSIYSISGIWSMCLVSTFFYDKKSINEKSKIKIRDLDVKKLFFSVSIGFFYACTDELHQLFVVGRSGEFIDVFIDTLGVLNGSLVTLLAYLVYKSFIKKPI